jgi:hypothetical protein
MGSQPSVDTSAQERAAARAQSDLKEVYQQQQQNAQPWMNAGTTALTSLANNDFMKNWQTDPGYQFRLDQGLKATAGSAGARGLNGSGATLKALANYGQNMASQEYGNVYNRESGRLTGLANLGMSAVNGLNGAAQNYGNQSANITTGLANAQAAAQMANAQAGQARAGQMGTLLGAGAGFALGGPAGASVGASMGAAGGQMLFSDERVKKDIEPISKKDLGEFQRAIKPYSFKYKDDEMGEGEYAGVMAQDLEKSKLGRKIVEEKDGVKTINLQKLASLSLAMMAKG